MRTFPGGATRDGDEDKLDFEGFLSPMAIEAYARYMHKHRQTVKGFRASDDWQRGIPCNVYMKSAWRHFFAVWKAHRGTDASLGTLQTMQDDLCALLFNVQGMLHELARELGTAGETTDRKGDKP